VCVLRCSTSYSQTSSSRILCSKYVILLTHRAVTLCLIYSIIIIYDSSSSSSSYVHIYHDDKHIIKHKYRMYDVRILSGNHNVRGVLRSITAVPAAAFVSSSNVPIQIKIYNNRHWLSVKTENFLLYGDSSPITVRIEIHCIILLPI